MVSLTLSEGCLGRVLIQAIHPLTYTRVVCTWNALLSRRSPSPPSPAWFLHGPRRKSPSVSYPCHRALHDTEYASGLLSIRTVSIFGLLSALRLLIAFEWFLKRTSTAVRLITDAPHLTCHAPSAAFLRISSASPNKTHYERALGTRWNFCFWEVRLCVKPL